MHINWKVPVVTIKIQSKHKNGKWEVGIKLFLRTSKGFVNVDGEALLLLHRPLCSEKRFYSELNFPAILGRTMCLCCVDAELVSGIAAVSLRLPPALKWKSISVTCDVITASGLRTSNPVCLGVKANSLLDLHSTWNGNASCVEPRWWKENRCGKAASWGTCPVRRRTWPGRGPAHGSLKRRICHHQHFLGTFFMYLK